jgi:lipid A 3-O-deacylase
MNIKSNPFFIIYLTLLSMVAFAQKEQANNKIQLLRIYEDNDFLDLRGSGTDRYYSNGLRIDVLYTKRKEAKFPSNLLYKLKQADDNIYGFGITQTMYTPLDISKKEIQYGDRPYAGLLHLNHTLVSSNHTRNERLVTEINLGLTGSLAFAKETQTLVHEWIKYQKPEGWDNQIKGDLLLNYYVQYEKLLLQPSHNIDVIGGFDANVGTMRTDAGISMLLRVGAANSYFSNYENPGVEEGSSKTKYKKLQFYFYSHPIVRAVMYNTTLEGGFFAGKNSAYKLESNDLNRIYLQFEYGFVFGYGRLGVAISEKLRTAEFKGALTQQVGNITLFIGL